MRGPWMIRPAIILPLTYMYQARSRGNRCFPIPRSLRDFDRGSENANGPMAPPCSITLPSTGHSSDG